MKSQKQKSNNIFKKFDRAVVSFGRFLHVLWSVYDYLVIAFGYYLIYSFHEMFKIRLSLSRKTLGTIVILSLVYTQIFGFNAFEAHVINVTAELVNDIPVATPPGGRFCDSERIEVTLSVNMEESDIIYTINGDTPECGATGFVYSGPFIIFNSGILKARTCHDGVQSIVNSWVFDFNRDYCGYDKQLLINKVYYKVDEAHGREGKNEWIELYNPTEMDIELKDWTLCDSDDCGTINPKVSIPAKGYALISHDNSTWKYWDVPEDVPTIHQLGGNFFEMNATAEMLILKHPDGDIVDQMNWGEVDSTWANFNSDLWLPGVVVGADDYMLGRVPSGYDTDTPGDWRALGLPEVEVTYPNGGEKWYVGMTYGLLWTATNPNGDDSALAIDIFYSSDSGKTWGQIVADTENDGAYDWRVPLFLEDFTYYVPSAKARIKVVAKGEENFMIRTWDMSDEDFCPPIDYELLTQEEIDFINSQGLPEETASSSSETASSSEESATTTDETEETNSSGNGKSSISTTDAATSSPENSDNASSSDESQATSSPEEKSEEDEKDEEKDEENNNEVTLNTSLSFFVTNEESDDEKEEEEESGEEDAKEETEQGKTEESEDESNISND